MVYEKQKVVPFQGVMVDGFVLFGKSNLMVEFCKTSAVLLERLKKVTLYSS
jgi:hypothetical protein